MDHFYNGSKALEVFVFVGCFGMFLIQIGVSVTEYLAFKTVTSIHAQTLADISIPHIVICHEKSYDIPSNQIGELVTGFEDDAVGWGEGVEMEPMEYLS